MFYYSNFIKLYFFLQVYHWHYVIFFSDYLLLNLVENKKITDPTKLVTK